MSPLLSSLHTERVAVMISSTSVDLPQHRDTVNEAVRRVGYYPLAMEHGSAEAGSNALSFSLGMVDQADLFIGIIAFRYGYVPDDAVANPNGWSVTEHEYRRAMERAIPVLIFLMHEDHPDAQEYADLSEAAQGKLEALKAELKTKHICGFFRSVDQLQARVIQSLSEIKLSLIQRHRARGSSGPFQSPPVPAHYVRRPDEEKRLEDDLLRQDEGPGVVVSAVFGLGGIGKSTLAAAVVQSQRVQERFADGVLWLTLGQNPELLSLLGQWIRDLGDHEFRAMDVRSASGRLRQLVQDRAVLLVVDDAWQSEHVEPFQIGGPRCRLLVTTRKPRIADDLHAISHELDVLSREQAIELLATRLQRPLREDERGAALRLAAAVGRLPLALELAAVRLGRGVAWEDLLLKLEQEVAALEALEDPADRWKKKGKTQLEASLQLSLRALRAEAEEAFRCFVWLGVLPDDTTLSTPMASALWDFQDAEEADGLLEFLWGEALLQTAVPVHVAERQWRGYRIHDLLHDCARRLIEAPDTPRRPEELPGLGLTRAEAHRQLLGRYRARTRDELWHTLAADGYIHGRLGWHLEKAGDVEGLHALLREETAEGRNGWYETTERLGQRSIFGDCLSQGCRLANKAFEEDRAEQTLALQCRYALVSASLNSLAGNLAPELLEALVVQGLWPVEQALAYARRTPDAGQKVNALTVLARFEQPDQRTMVLSEALAAARDIENAQSRSTALAALAPHLPEHERAPVLSEALAAALSIWGTSERSRRLAALAPHLAEEERANALAALRSIGYKGDQSFVLAALALHLPEQEYAEVVSEALAATRFIENERDRSEALAALAPHLSAGLLSEALAAARSIGDEWHRSRALVALAPHLSAGLLAGALAAARSIGRERPRADALAALVPDLAEQERAAVLSEVLAAARSIRPEEDRCKPLAALALLLPEQERAEALAEALAAARSLRREEFRSEVLAALAPHLPEKERAAVLAEALAAARDIREEWDRARALAALAPRLPEQERATVLSEALAADPSSADEWHRSRALAGLPPHLAGRLLSEALAAARSLRDARSRSRSLAVLAPRLPGGLLLEALAAARSLSDEGTRASALAALAPQLPEQERAGVLSEALAAARSIESERERLTALAALSPHLPEQERAAVLAEALAAARSLGREQYRSRALAALVPHLAEQERAVVLAEALATARDIWEEWDRARELAVLASQLPDKERATVLSEALAAARSIEDQQSRARVLAALAPHLPEQERAPVLFEALAAARSSGHEGAYSDTLVALAPYLPTGLLSEALAAARSIEYEGSRSRALAALAPRLSSKDLSSLWLHTFPSLAVRTRRDLLADLPSLTPGLAALARPNTSSELLEIARAISDVARWWP